MLWDFARWVRCVSSFFFFFFGNWFSALNTIHVSSYNILMMLLSAMSVCSTAIRFEPRASCCDLICVGFKIEIGQIVVLFILHCWAINLVTQIGCTLDFSRSEARPNFSQKFISDDNSNLALPLQSTCIELLTFSNFVNWNNVSSFVWNDRSSPNEEKISAK